jgi:hypothetical protein
MARSVGTERQALQIIEHIDFDGALNEVRRRAARTRGEGHVTPSILIKRRSGPRTTAVER